MPSHDRILSVALVLVGAGFFLIYPMALLWPSGWAWHQGSPLADNYFMMIVGVYAVLGIFLIRAVANPQAHRSLIWFTIWSSIVHALIMGAQALDSMHRGHLIGDVPALLASGLVLGLLMHGAERRAASKPNE